MISCKENQQAVKTVKTADACQPLVCQWAMPIQFAGFSSRGDVWRYCPQTCTLVPHFAPLRAAVTPQSRAQSCKPAHGSDLG